MFPWEAFAAHSCSDFLLMEDFSGGVRLAFSSFVVDKSVYYQEMFIFHVDALYYLKLIKDYSLQGYVALDWPTYQFRDRDMKV